MRLNRRSGVVFFMGLSAICPTIAGENKEKGAEIARVAVIHYEDKTGTRNFGYMPDSLKDAINSSMHSKFEFVDVDPAKVEPVVAELRKSHKGKIDPKVAAEICRRTDTDILIYGYFTFNKEENEIEIHTEISLGSSDKFRTLAPTENRVDATIFKAADKVAGDIVAEITKVAIEQQQAKGEAEKKQKGKTQLAKTEKLKTWADLNWMITISPGAHFPLVSQENTSISPDVLLSGYAAYRLKNNWHLGGYGSFGGFKSNKNGYRTDFDALTVAATLGYFFDLSARWRLTTLAGGGYYFGRLNNYQEQASSSSSGSGIFFQPTQANVKNPMALVRVGFHYLLFSFLSLGIEANGTMYYDNKPLFTGGGHLSLSIVF